MQRWIVVIAGIVAMLGPGAVYSFSLLSGPLAAAFGWAPSQVVWAFAMANFFLAAGGFAGGVLTDRFGPRLIAMIGVTLWAAGYAACGLLAVTHDLGMFYLCYGVAGGFGCGMTYIAVLTTAIRWFPRARGLGAGLVVTGFGVGSFIYTSLLRGWAPFAKLGAPAQNYASALGASLAAHVPFDAGSFLLQKPDVDALMTIFFASGAVFAIVGLGASFALRLPPIDEAAVGASGEQFTLPQMLGDARFYILWATLFLSVFGGVTLISNMVPLMHELTGMSTSDAAGLYAALAIFNGAGRFVWGFASDRIGRRMTFVILFAGQALAFIALGNNHEVVIIGISIALLLFCYGGGFATMPAFNADLFGTKHFGANYGLQLSAWGLAGIAGTGLGSVLHDATGSFAGMTQPLTIIAIVAIFFPLILGEAQRRALESV